MAEDHVQQYMNARVESAKTLADAYRHYEENPDVFVAGVQYALDHILGNSERAAALALPPYPGLGIVVPFSSLNVLAVDILGKAKRGTL
jgi:hypothetical protein